MPKMKMVPPVLYQLKTKVSFDAHVIRQAINCLNEGSDWFLKYSHQNTKITTSDIFYMDQSSSSFKSDVYVQKYQETKGNVKHVVLLMMKHITTQITEPGMKSKYEKSGMIQLVWISELY